MEGTEPQTIKAKETTFVKTYLRDYLLWVGKQLPST